MGRIGNNEVAGRVERETVRIGNSETDLNGSIGIKRPCDVGNTKYSLRALVDDKQAARRIDRQRRRIAVAHGNQLLNSTAYGRLQSIDLTAARIRDDHVAGTIHSDSRRLVQSSANDDWR